MKLRAPTNDGELLLWPPAAEWPGLVEHNRRLLGAAFAAGKLRKLGGIGRASAMQEADSPDNADGSPLSPQPVYTAPLIVTGHQAEPFHPGVWVKNFLIRRLADAVGGNALNLIVDTDAPRTSFLPVPVVTDGHPAVENVRFADLRPDRAMCEQRIDRDILRSAAAEVCRAQHNPDSCRGFGYWAAAIKASERARVDAATVLSCGRIAAEAELLGRTNRELWISALPWREWMADLDAERFRTIYNSAIDDYRRRNKVRGKGRPVPPLARDGDRVELPFWGWHPGGPRLRLFCRNDRLFLEDEPVAADKIQIAPRALALTMFARLFIADLFIHGIGGAKYDEVTDDIIRRYYGVEPPKYVVATATLHLPLPTSPVGGADRLALARRMRDLQFNPERVVTLTADERGLVNEKRRLIAEDAELRTRSDHAELHEQRRSVRIRIAEINRRLADGHPESAAELDRRGAEIEAALRYNRIARNREWFFGLYPPEKIRGLLAKLPDFR